MVDLTVLPGTCVMAALLLGTTQVGIPAGGAVPLQGIDPVEIRWSLLA